MSTQANAFHTLFRSLNARKRPEDVAELVSEVLCGELSQSESATLAKATLTSQKQMTYWYSSMLQEFQKPVGMRKQVRKSEELFDVSSRLSSAKCTEPSVLDPYLHSLSEQLNRQVGSDFKQRLNREERLAAGMDISKRRYNKLYRVLGRMEAKLATLVRELKKVEFTKIGKSSLASKLDWLSFSSDVNTGCFIAYYTARCNLRSEFTIGGQERPFDEVAEMLLARCIEGQANFWAIAHVYPEPAILTHLSDEEKGMLLAAWYEILVDVAAILREVWEKSNIAKETMIVRLGNDSSTWNQIANAWNKARRSWIGILYALGMESVLDAICPGKVLRLMAGDVSAWHSMSGGGLDPDTRVWNTVPLPWEVLEGERRCTRETIVWACREFGVSAKDRGWISPPPTRKAVPFRRTPELVHGVAVGSPALASVLRKAGWFSGKAAKYQFASK